MLCLNVQKHPENPLVSLQTLGSGNSFHISRCYKMKINPQKKLCALDFSIPESEAKKLAKKMFYQLNKSSKSVLGEEEVYDLLQATYQGLRVEDGVTLDDVVGYINFHGNTKVHGKITYQEFEDMVVRVLCLADRDEIDELHERRRRNRKVKETLQTELNTIIGKEKVEQELQSALTLFQRYDVNRNGYLEPFEVPQILIDTYTAMGRECQPTEEDVQQYIEMMDLDEDGKISSTEYDIFVLKALEARGIKL